MTGSDSPRRPLWVASLLLALAALALLATACSGSTPAESSDAAEAEEQAAGDEATSDDPAQDEPEDVRAELLQQDTPVASAPGVTDTTIRIGVILRDVNQLIGSGFVENLTVSMQTDRWRAEQARINNAGGIQGRRVEIVVASYDPLAPESLLTACDRIVEERDAFVVLNVAGLETIATECLVDPYARPVIVAENPTLADFAEGDGLLFSLEPPREVLAATAIARFERDGLLAGRVAVVHNDGVVDISSAEAAVEALDELGYDVVTQEIPTSQGVEAAIETLPTKVEELIAGQTETLVMLSNSTIAGPFGDEMSRLGAEWNNLIIDVDNIADPFAASRLGAGWYGTQGLGTYGGTVLPETPIATECRIGWNKFLNGEYANMRPKGDWTFSSGLEERAVRGAASDSVEPPGDIGYTECLLMFLVRSALDRGPLNFTVPDFVANLETVRRIQMPLGASGSFNENKHWLADRALLFQYLPFSSGLCPTEGRDCFVPQGLNRSSFRPLLDPPAPEDPQS